MSDDSEFQIEFTKPKGLGDPDDIGVGQVVMPCHGTSVRIVSSQLLDSVQFGCPICGRVAEVLPEMP